GAHAVPDATPNHLTLGTALDVGTLGANIGELIPIWRSAATVSTLKLDAGDGGGPDQRVFRIDDPGRRYFIGRKEQREDGTPNDFVVPRAWNSVSRSQGIIATMDDGGVAFTNTSANRVFVRGESVPNGATRSLRHGDVVQLGRCIGVFSDGRYYTGAPAAAI